MISLPDPSLMECPLVIAPMAKLPLSDPALYAGLQALAESAFPKRCNTCGRVYPDAASFVAQTQMVPSGTGLKASQDDGGLPIVELFRNCVCGSTLLDVFGDRRDLSPEGQARRARFGEMLDYLETQGFRRNEARLELLNVLRGDSAKVVEDIRLDTPKPSI